MSRWSLKYCSLRGETVIGLGFDDDAIATMHDRAALSCAQLRIFFCCRKCVKKQPYVRLIQYCFGESTQNTKNRTTSSFMSSSTSDRTFSFARSRSPQFRRDSTTSLRQSRDRLGAQDAELTRDVLLCADGRLLISPALQIDVGDEKASTVATLYLDMCPCCRRAYVQGSPKRLFEAFCDDCSLSPDRWSTVLTFIERVNRSPRGHVAGRYRYQNIASIKQASNDINGNHVSVLDVDIQRSYLALLFTDEPYVVQ